MPDVHSLPHTSDLAFVVVKEDRLAVVADTGLEIAGRLFPALGEASEASGDDEVVLVVRGATYGREGIGSEQIANLDPHLEPAEVFAGGGIVIRTAGYEPEVLLIFRRGVWDLPKGKADGGETIEQCALREVREEIGASDLRMLGPAGTTVHGYPERDRYLVKTTTWFFMSTSDQSFTPQFEEDIERVEWMPWSEALERLGHESLRKHVERLGQEAAMKVLAE